MNRLRKRRLLFVLFIVSGISISLAAVLYALKQNINVFFTPTQVMEQTPSLSHPFRLGGLVKKGSVQRNKKNLFVKFIVQDKHHAILVEYQGILPDLFREGKGIVVTGQLTSLGVFKATEVLAKHDERYVPGEYQ